MRRMLGALQVAGEAVKDLPSWAGPDVIIAAAMSKLDGIVAAASAEVCCMLVNLACWVWPCTSCSLVKWDDWAECCSFCRALQSILLCNSLKAVRI